jgi:tRNA pseudouridine55 synthase
LQKAKWLLRAEKAGHTGTLDPLATGVLPLCFGAATKFGQLQLDADKTYEATIQLGVKTSTGDEEGDVVEERAVPIITADLLEQVAKRFTGPISQVPPMHSALKKDGKPLYEYARAGEEIEREPRDVVVHSLSLSLAGEGTLKLVTTVSKGTYIRALGEDIGEALGCGGHLTSLRRTASGAVTVDQCITLEALEGMSEDERLAQVRPAESLVTDHAHVTLDAENSARFLSGLRRRGEWADQEQVAVFSPDAFIGTAHVKAGELIPGRLLSPIEIQQILQAAP